MKRSVSLTLFVAIWISACSGNIHSTAGTSTPSAATPALLPHSMKGYELYSWQTEGQWQFTLTTGTNRVKSHEEITTGEDTVTIDGWVKMSTQGVDALKSVLGRLPQHEEIVWVSQLLLEQAGVEASIIALPPQEIIDAIRETCKQLGLELIVGGIPPSGFMFIMDARHNGDNAAQPVNIRINA